MSYAQYNKCTPTSHEQKLQIRKILGKLQWLAVQVVPQLSFFVASVIAKIETSTVGDNLAINKTIRRIQTSEIPEMYISNMGADVSHWKVVSFSDASLANCPDGATQGGHLLFLVGPNQISALISWQLRH